MKKALTILVFSKTFLQYLMGIEAKGSWRHEPGRRESIGISEDGKYVYGKTMNDTVVAFTTNAVMPELHGK